METFGRWCDETKLLLSRIAKLKAKRTGDEFAKIHAYLKGRVSLVLQKHVGSMILSRET